MTTIPSGFGEIIFHYDIPGGVGTPAASSLGVTVPGTTSIGDGPALLAFWETGLQAFTSTAVALLDITLEYNLGAGVQSWVYPTSPVAGSQTGTRMVPQVSYLVKKLTAAPGRSGRGRMYLPGCTSDSVDTNGAVDPSFVSDRNADLVSMLLDMSSSDYSAMLLHSGAGTPNDIVNMSCEVTVATQRRRMR